jgi:hypothetical protein
MRMSWVLAAETAKGSPWPSDRMCAALLAPVDRIAPGQTAPFLARTAAASTIALLQSTSPWAPSSSSTA